MFQPYSQHSLHKLMETPKRVIHPMYMRAETALTNLCIRAGSP